MRETRGSCWGSGVYEMRCGSGLLNCHSYFVQGVSVLLDSSNRRLHVSLSPQLILFSTCPRRCSPEFRGPWICQQPEVDRRGCRLEHEHDFFSTYLSSHYHFFIILTVLGICTELWWEAEEGQAESRDSHTWSMIITAGSCEICSVFKIVRFLEQMVLGGIYWLVSS